VGSATIFNVSGAHTTQFAQLFENTLQAAATAGTLFVGSESGGSFPTAPTGGTAEAYIGPTQIGDSATIPAGYSYLFDNANGATTITGSNGAGDSTSGGDHVLVAGVNAAATYLDMGGNNQVLFVNGNNIYQGGTASGSDTVVAGSGFDSIYTGTGLTTVASGTGDSLIILNDTPPGLETMQPLNGASTVPPGDLVSIDEGSATVVANGAHDYVFLNNPAAGSTVFGGTTATTSSMVDLNSAHNVVVAESGTMNVFANASGNMVWAGTDTASTTNFVSNAPLPSDTIAVSNTVVGGSGTLTMFGNDSTNLTFYTPAQSSPGSSTFIAGQGNETLNGAGAGSGFAAWASTDSASNDSITGGYGNDTLVSGAGHDTLTGGAGNNQFYITKGEIGGAHILITDFGASAGNSLLNGGYSDSQWSQAMSTAQETSSGGMASLQLTFADGTQVVLQGVSSLNNSHGV
jgi:Ca2+-binding RTX toxin-like protein